MNHEHKSAFSAILQLAQAQMCHQFVHVAAQHSRTKNGSYLMCRALALIRTHND